ncbi:MAG: SLC13 family permease [Vicinamibacterales bacterium]|nr:SLC13 family permease [Vicinamibacterales bacterium]
MALSTAGAASVANPGLRLLLIASVGLVLLALPAPATLGVAGSRTGIIFVVALLLWVTEALPMAVTALLVLVLQPLLGVAPARTAFTTFMSPVFFFVLAMFAIALVIVSTGLDRRFALWLLARAGTSPRRVVGAFMAGTAALSSIMSDVPACAIFMALAVGVLNRAGVPVGGSAFGKALMIGIPMAAYIGGVATPVGSSVNIVGMHFIEQFGGVRVPFVTWMLIGVPMAVVLVPLAATVLVAVYPPEIETVGHIDEVLAERRGLGGISAPEWKAVMVIGAMIGLWTASSWVPALDLTLIAVTGAIVMFLPGVRLLTWAEAERGIGWSVLFLLGAVTSLGAASEATGLATWIVDAALGGIAGWPIAAMVAAIGTLTVLVLLVLPIGPVVNAILIPPISVLALAHDTHPLTYTLPVAFTASCALLLPLNPVGAITYSRGYYQMHDMLGPGLLVSLAWVVWITVLMVTFLPVLAGGA